MEGTEVDIAGTRVCAIARGAGGICTLKINGTGKATEGFPRFYACFGDEEKHAKSMVNWIKLSLEVSSRALLDLAQVYAGGYADIVVRKALEIFPRESYFIAWKIHPSSLITKSDFEASVRNGLRNLGIESIDLLLTHQTPPNMEEYLPWMEETMQRGYAQSIGLGQVTSQLLQKSLTVSRRICAIQNSASPQISYVDDELATLCKENGITVMAYRPYGGVRRDIPSVARIAPIASAHGITVAQTAIAWARTKGFLPISGAMNVSHMVENLDALTVRLTPEEVKIVGGETQ